MAKKLPKCPQCGEELVDKPKVGFFGGHKEYLCEHCKFKAGLPLWTSTRILYWTMTVLAVLVVIEMATGGKGNIGIFGLIAPWLLYKDWQDKKKIKEYEKVNGWNYHSTQPSEKYGVLKGIVFSILFVLITLAVSAFYYGEGNAFDNSTTTTKPTSNTITANAQQSTWQMFTSVEGNFRINLPTYPTQSSSTDQIKGLDVPTTQYTSIATNGDQYMVQYAVYPVKLDSKLTLEGTVNGSVNSDPTNKLVESSFTTHQNFPAVDYVIYNNGESLYINGRNILVGSTLYMTLVVSKDRLPSDYTKFINSFELIPSSGK
ncbi:MAG: hypothetical protein ABI425_04340 [Patescibacteria group bacterium]